jgi:hypothetical protein
VYVIITVAKEHSANGANVRTLLLKKREAIPVDKVSIWVINIKSNKYEMLGPGTY